MIGLLFIVEVSHPGDERLVPILLGPGYRIGLGLGGVKSMICMILDDIIFNWGSFRAALRACLDKYVCHLVSIPDVRRPQEQGAASGALAQATC